MKVTIPTIQFDLTTREACIMKAIFDNIHEEDPYGEASTQLGIDINEVVAVATAFENALKRMP